MHSPVPQSGIEGLRAVKKKKNLSTYFPGFFHPKWFWAMLCTQQSSWGLNPTMQQIHNLCCLPHCAYRDPSFGKFVAFTCFIAGCALPYLRAIFSWHLAGCVCIQHLWYGNDISIQTISSVMKHLWEQLQPPVFLAMMSRALHTWIWGYSDTLQILQGIWDPAWFN